LLQLTITMASNESQPTQPLFTCLSCTIAFLTAEEQRLHYRSDHHRYNMKRRVAGLPPISSVIFNQKVLERREETAVMLSPKGSTCEACNKYYTTENAYRSHMNSKKHRENELRALSKPKPVAQFDSTSPEEIDAPNLIPTHSPEPNTDGNPNIAVTVVKGVSLAVAEDATEEEVNIALDQKIAAARSRLSPAHCLFCTVLSPSLEENLTHMSTVHSFFVPDAEYLVDLPGLISYLGEKVAVGNVCLYCNRKSREFRSLEATRKHMLDKSHCKIAYDSEFDMLEVSDYYDFTSSYPDAEEYFKRKAERRAEREKSRRIAEDKQSLGVVEDEWEDEEDNGHEVDEVVDVDPSSPRDSDSLSSEESDDDDDSDDDGLLGNQITYGDTHYELVLPNGARLIHRDMQRYFKQRIPLSTPGRGGHADDPNSGAAFVRRLLAEKNSALVPRKGGFGAFGAGMEVVKARNAGEAREAGRHVREFRDQNRREQFKTKVGFRHNYQKHFRDPLLQ